MTESSIESHPHESEAELKLKRTDSVETHHTDAVSTQGSAAHSPSTPGKGNDVDASPLIEDSYLQSACEKVENLGDLSANQLFPLVESELGLPAGTFKADKELKTRLKRIAVAVSTTKECQPPLLKSEDTTTDPGDASSTNSETTGEPQKRQSKKDKKDRSDAKPPSGGKRKAAQEESESDANPRKTTKRKRENDQEVELDSRPAKGKKGKHRKAEKAGTVEPPVSSKEKKRQAKKQNLTKLIRALRFGVVIYKGLDKESNTYNADLQARIEEKCVSLGICSEGLPDAAEVKAFKTKNALQRELEGVDTANIVAEGSKRPTRGAARVARAAMSEYASRPKGEGRDEEEDSSEDEDEDEESSGKNDGEALQNSCGEVDGQSSESSDAAESSDAHDSCDDEGDYSSDSN